MNGTSYYSGMAIQDIHCLIANKRYNLTFYWDINMPKTSTSFSIKLWSNMMNNIQTLKMRYLLVDSNWLTLEFDWYKYSTNNIVSSSTPYTQTFAGLPTLNMTGPYRVFACLTGFVATTATTANELSFILTVTRLNATALIYDLTSLSFTIINW